jgi:NAD+ kinase
MSVRVGVVGQRSNTRAVRLAAEIRRKVDATVLLDVATAAALEVADEGVAVADMADCDMVVSIGGDGTFLFAARGSGGAPVMGVNLGEVGFLNAVTPDEAIETVSAEVGRIAEHGAPRLREMPKVRATGDGWSLPPALNEVAVMGAQRGRNNGLDIEVHINNSLYSDTHADGVLICTPTGSTAYNLSEGGPIVHPGVTGFTVTEMAAENPMPSLVVGAESTVTVQVAGDETAVVVADGWKTQELSPPTEITLNRASKPLQVAGPPLDFFAALAKLD